jgi:hypothetical protein
MRQMLCALALITCTAGASLAAGCDKPAFTQEQILAAQKAWGDGIVAIGKAKDPRAVARQHIDTLYGYDLGPVLFKPTKARVDPFRGTKDEALSYFVGGSIPEDKGFALAPFTGVRFENEAITIDCDSALAMGHYYFTPAEGQDIMVEYSFGYVPDAKGNVRINLQHSSLPYHQ